MSQESAASVAMARYAAGDDAAFAEVYDAVAPPLERYLARRCRDRALVEDLLQQTFLKIHCHRARFIAGSEVLPWACSIAVRLLIDRVRHDRRASLQISVADEADAPSQGADPDEALLGHELARQVAQALGRIPADQRQAITMMRQDGLSADEAARLLGTTPNAAKIRLFRGLRSLRALLGRPDPPPSSRPPPPPAAARPGRRGPDGAGPEGPPPPPQVNP